LKQLRYILRADITFFAHPVQTGLLLLKLSDIIQYYAFIQYSGNDISHTYQGGNHRDIGRVSKSSIRFVYCVNVKEKTDYILIIGT